MPDAWTAFILSILVSFLLWSLYFDMTSEQEAKPGYGNLQWFSFLHFPLLASLGVVGACIKYMLLHMNEGVGIDMQWLFCIATVVILLAIAGITRVMKEEEEDRSYILPVRRLLIGLSALFLLIPVSGMIDSVLFFLSTVCVLLLIPVIYGVIKWIRYRTSRN
jgi:low temperature requirement protein LtrA